MTRLVAATLAIALVAGTGSAAWAAESPARAFLAAVRGHLEDAYFAKPGVDVAAIMDDAERRLEASCASSGSDCPVEAGVYAAKLALAMLGDPHTRIEQAAGAAGGPAGATSPMGWLVRKARGGETLYVAWVAPEGPAARAGVRRHDIISDTADLTAAVLTAFDQPLRVKLSRKGAVTEVALEPERGRAGPMPRLDRIGDTAVLQVPVGSGAGVAQAAHDLVAQAQADDVRALVLDLRDNGGGGVQCAAMASAFVEYSTILTDRNGGQRIITVSPGHARIASGNDVEELKVERPARWTGPLAILVNENTGSCSEAVSIQASRAGRAIIVGEPSVGVGNNVIQPAPLPRGWRLLMTVAYSTAPNGEALPARPPLDVEVDDDPAAIALTGRDAVLEAAVEALATKS